MTIHTVLLLNTPHEQLGLAAKTGDNNRSSPKPPVSDGSSNVGGFRDITGGKTGGFQDITGGASSTGFSGLSGGNTGGFKDITGGKTGNMEDVGLGSNTGVPS
jgi:hypothetical protein